MVEMRKSFYDPVDLVFWRCYGFTVWDMELKVL